MARIFWTPNGAVLDNSNLTAWSRSGAILMTGGSSTPNAAVKTGFFFFGSLAVSFGIDFMLNTIKKVLLSSMLVFGLNAAEPRNIGSLTITNALLWDAETNINKFNLYIGELKPQLQGTNITVYTTNFVLVKTLTTNKWFGDSTKQWYGPKPVYVTAIDAAGQESDPSEIIVLNFRAGIPLAPNNFQLFSVVTAMATNSVPPLP